VANKRLKSSPAQKKSMDATLHVENLWPVGYIRARESVMLEIAVSALSSGRCRVGVEVPQRKLCVERVSNANASAPHTKTVGDINVNENVATGIAHLVKKSVGGG